MNAVLATEARRRGPVELWTAAIGGSLDAALLWVRTPSLHWLAAAFAATAAYGLWGLADRWISELQFTNTESRTTRALSVLARAARTLAGAGGWATALMAIYLLLTSLLGGLALPGR